MGPLPNRARNPFAPSPSKPDTMMRTALLAVGLLCLPASAQLTADGQPILDWEDAQHRAARIARTGDLGMAPLPPLTADSPRDSIVFADRVPVTPPDQDSYSGGAVIQDGFIPAGPGGTGTSLPEIFKYQVPTGYTPNGTPHPLIVAYHGFGGSANSVGIQSTIDEEADARNWLYLSPTGIDDKLFGSPICQQHTEIAIQWMIDNFNVDEDRIYMVGFSMGGGIVSNFAARRRDPEGIMIAAAGVVSGALDWTKSWVLGDGPLQDWLENEYNFFDNPANEGWKYIQASAIYQDPGTYPPLPGVLVPSLSMASNNELVPTYITYDTGDTLTEVPGSNDLLESLLQLQGTQTFKRVVSGTLGGDGMPAPHSWAVLDEVECFDFLEQFTANRAPTDFDAMQDEGKAVSWATTTQNTVEQFTYLDGAVDSGNGELILDRVSNASQVAVDVDVAGVATGALRVTAESADANGFTLRLENFDLPPSYLVEHGTSNLITLVDSDPSSNALIVDVPGNAAIDVDVITNSKWVGELVSSPNPTALGQLTNIDINMRSTSTTAYMIVAIEEALYGAKGLTLTALAVPPALVIFVPLDVDGDANFDALIPNDPALSGLRFPCQVVGLDAGNNGDSASNLWGLYID